MGDPITGQWLLDHGYALAGSSYASTGWAIQQALPDQIGTLNVFDQTVGRPKQTIAWGHSLGGIITAGLIQRYPNRFDAALPMCGVLSGGVATWNTALDSAFAFKTLLAPAVQIVDITNPIGNLGAAESARPRPSDGAGPGEAGARRGPGGHAGLVHATIATARRERLRRTGGEPVRVGLPGRLPVRVRAPGRARARAGRQPVVEHRRQLLPGLRPLRRCPRGACSVQAAGLNLRSDLRTLNQTPRISADPAAVRYLERNIIFNGRLSMPVLTMHTTGDGLVVPENEQAYRQVVRQAGDSQLLRQIFVARAGHCAFTPAETITAAQDLLHRLDTGHWGGGATNPRS